MNGTTGNDVPRGSANVEMLALHLTRRYPRSFVIKVETIWAAGLRAKRFRAIGSQLPVEINTLFAIDVEDD